MGQRVRKTHPEGGLSGLGMSPLEQDRLARYCRVWHRDGREQGLGVRVARVGVKLMAGGDFHDAAEIHDDDAVADVFNYRQVVRDKKQGEAEFFLQVLEEIDDLGLHRDIKRGDRLVSDDQARADGERARDADPLTLPAGEFMRVAVSVGGGEGQRARAVRRCGAGVRAREQGRGSGAPGRRWRRRSCAG